MSPTPPDRRPAAPGAGFPLSTDPGVRPISPRAQAFALCGALALFVALAALRAWDHPYPFYDDVAYLDAASRIREAGGLGHFVASLFAGEWAEDNRNPLYLALLSLVSGRDVGFHLRAKVLGVALGALALLAAWWTTRRLFGARAALWMALLLACSETLVGWSAREACEPLLLLFCALAFERLVRDAPTRGALFAGGLSAGIAQLTKGTGIFVAICAALALAWEARERLQRRLGDARRAVMNALAGMAALFAGLALGGLPLFVRNLRRFHSPLHNYNDRFLWIDPLDDFSEVFAPGALERLDRGAIAYLRALTPAKALLRAGRGLGETLVHLGDSLSLVSPRPFGPVHIAWLALGLVAAGIALRLLWRWPRGFARTFLLVHAGFNFAFFAFYNAVSGSSRYLMPLSLSLLFPLVRALAARTPPGSSCLAWLKPSALRAPGAWGPRTLAACALAVLLAVALDPREHAPPPGFAAAFEAIRARVQPGETFAIDARTRLQPYWAMDPSVHMEIVSTSWEGRLLPMSSLLDVLRARRVRWVLLDGTSRKDSEPRWFFAEALPLEPDGSLPLGHGPAALPEGVRLDWLDPGAPRRFALLELTPGP